MAGTIAALPSAINKDTLATYEKQSRVELQAESGANTKGLQAMSDMKKRLEAFRESKKKKSKVKRSDSPEIIEVNNSGQAWAAKGKEHQEEKEMEPLILLRKYATLGKKVVERGTNLDFNGVFHPKSVRTPLKSGKVGEVAEFYTLGVLSYFITNLNMDHPEYVRKCINAKLKAVRGPDRMNIQDYLTGQKNYVINLENLSHRELNPEMFGGEAFAPEKLRKGSEVRSITGEVVAVGRTEAELKLDRWKEKNLPGAEEQLSGSSRSRTRSPGRRRRSRSRSQSRRKRSRSRSQGRRKRSRSRSRMSKGFSHFSKEDARKPEKRWRGSSQSRVEEKDAVGMKEIKLEKRDTCQGLVRERDGENISGGEKVSKEQVKVKVKVKEEMGEVAKASDGVPEVASELPKEDNHLARLLKEDEDSGASPKKVMGTHPENTD